MGVVWEATGNCWCNDMIKKTKEDREIQVEACKTFLTKCEKTGHGLGLDNGGLSFILRDKIWLATHKYISEAALLQACQELGIPVEPFTDDDHCDHIIGVTPKSVIAV